MAVRQRDAGYRRRPRLRPWIAGVLIAALSACLAAGNATAADFKWPDPYAGKKKVLIVGDLHTGNQIAHDAVSHAMATLERLGRDTGTYIAFLRTDTQLVTKAEVWGSGDYAKGGPKQAPGRNLDYFDAVVFYTNGETEMTPQQKHDLLGFIHDDGKGFVAVHSATASFYSWPEYGDMIGGYFDNHPWSGPPQVSGAFGARHCESQEHEDQGCGTSWNDCAAVPLQS